MLTKFSVTDMCKLDDRAEVNRAGADTDADTDALSAEFVLQVSFKRLSFH